jgi:hypothetical protein
MMERQRSVQSPLPLAIKLLPGYFQGIRAKAAGVFDNSPAAFLDTCFNQDNRHSRLSLRFKMTFVAIYPAAANTAKTTQLNSISVLIWAAVGTEEKNNGYSVVFQKRYIIRMQYHLD